jgi:hypothetical protein
MTLIIRNKYKKSLKSRILSVTSRINSVLVPKVCSGEIFL